MKGHPANASADKEFPVLITSFEMVLSERKFLQRYKFKYIVVDEGHRLKNFDCKLLRELKFVPSDNKLLLTGTPLQNNLPELWSLLHFLLPDVFTSLSQFQSWFDFSNTVVTKGDGDTEEDTAARAALAEDERRNKVVTKLHSILRPFLLRRIKDQVEKSLPKKKEILLWAGMSEHQEQFNRALVDKTISDLLEKMSGGSVSGQGRVQMASTLNNVLMQLRKNCNHPDLI